MASMCISALAINFRQSFLVHSLDPIILIMVMSSAVLNVSAFSDAIMLSTINNRLWFLRIAAFVLLTIRRQSLSAQSYRMQCSRYRSAPFTGWDSKKSAPTSSSLESEGRAFDASAITSGMSCAMVFPFMFGN